MARSSEPKVNATFRLPPDLLALLTAYAAVRTAEIRREKGRLAKRMDRTGAVIELLRSALTYWMEKRA